MAIRRIGFYAVVLPALVALVGGVQAASGLIAGRTARFERHEQPLRRGPLRGHGPRQGAHA